MRRVLVPAALLACGLTAAVHAQDDNSSDDRDDASPLTIAVYGDAPYGCKAPTSAHAADECPDASVRPDTPSGPNPGDPRQLEATPAFIEAINDDPKVRLVVHVGDIHSGQQYCTLAYDQTIAKLWSAYADPLVYTPGDNEWADCHKSGEGGNVQAKDAQGNPISNYFVDYANGDPVANLALVRSIFFATPGKTLGGRTQRVTSQAIAYDPAHPTDAEYVENVMWTRSQVVFATLNIPGGSNNDTDPWFKAATQSQTQLQEVKQRTDADLRWLDATFATAQTSRAKAIVIVEQADMWDRDGATNSDHIVNYEVFIDEIAGKAKQFGKPVLLINGDSHTYRSDNPLQNDRPCAIESGATIVNCADDAWDTHAAKNYDVTNFHRLVVHGSTFPLEYLHLTVDPRADNPNGADAFGPFSWERVIP